ncbi:hypothetical protein AMECASPLE_012739 [Ameca splendens]|uniref:Uncharacterized protein n=1 Tax=Ameca splendens TaxID=208324 RepID=A0ABV0ZWX9_9TELE
MRDTRPNNADELEATIKAAWPCITSHQNHRLIASMLRSTDVDAKGALTMHLSATKQCQFCIATIPL